MLKMKGSNEMKYIIINFLRLNELPPAISLLEYLNKSALSGRYITLYPELYSDKYRNIVFSNIYEKKEVFSGERGIKERIKYKKEAVKKQLAVKQVLKIVDNYYDEETILWFLHESTVLMFGKKLKKYNYYVTLYELDAAQNDKRGRLKYICQNAEKVIVPEETRAHIIKAFLELAKSPFVIHNKPFIEENEKENIYFNNIKEIIEKMNLWKQEKKMIFLYAGIFIPERKLDNIISAFSNRTNDTKLVLMGRRSYYLDELIEKYKGKFEYMGFFNPPEHLEIIKRADVGILTYTSKNGSINAIFCAPNKIFEYGIFGLPVLGNNIPGLKNVIEHNEIGRCFEEECIKSIESSIDYVIKNYDEYSKNIIKYVNGINTEAEIEKVLLPVKAD